MWIKYTKIHTKNELEKNVESTVGKILDKKLAFFESRVIIVT